MIINIMLQWNKLCLTSNHERHHQACTSDTFTYWV